MSPGTSIPFGVTFYTCPIYTYTIRWQGRRGDAGRELGLLTFSLVVDAGLAVQVVRVLFVAVPVGPPLPGHFVALARVRQEGDLQRHRRGGEVLHACSDDGYRTVICQLAIGYATAENANAQSNPVRTKRCVLCAARYACVFHARMLVVFNT